MKILIIKLGALGDVVRTTVLLNELDGEIHWLTSQLARPLLNSQKIKRIYSFENEKEKDELKDIEFDLVLSLDEEEEPLRFLNNLKVKKLIGHFFNEKNQVDYTPECNYWLDMSFISKRFSRQEADKLKFLNQKTIPQILIELINKERTGQEYDLGIKPKSLEECNGKIGLIDITESKWSNKYWAGYSKLKQKLEEGRYKVFFLGLKSSIQEHIEDINNCEVIVCGDTLGMHIALALKKKVVALFNCTPPNEIYGYGRITKIVSPLLERYFMSRENTPEIQSSIPIEEVYSKIKTILG